MYCAAYIPTISGVTNSCTSTYKENHQLLIINNNYYSLFFIKTNHNHF